MHLVLAALILTTGCSDDRREETTGPGASASNPEGVPAPDEGTNDPTDAGTNPGTTPAEDGGSSAPADSCVDGETRCTPTGLPQRCNQGRWLDALPCDPDLTCVEGRCTLPVDCDPGSVEGCVDAHSQRVCNAEGSGYEGRTCPDEAPLCFRGECGHQICQPESRRCRTTSVVEACSEDGTTWNGVGVCDLAATEVCLRGECVRGCEAATKNRSYIGCEYWSVDLPQYDDPISNPQGVPHAVVISNPGDRPARITIETQSGQPMPPPFEVAAGGTRTVEFPILGVEGTGRSQKSFRISTSEPVVAYQFNPLNNENVASNDASLLLPSNAIGREYYVLTWPGGIGVEMLNFAPQSAWFTIVATVAGSTNVRVTFASTVMDGGELAGIAPGDSRDFVLEQWDVFNFEVESRFEGLSGINEDPTGTHIQSDQPIVVFAGHQEAVIDQRPQEAVANSAEVDSACCADHLEQQLFPVETWGQRYLAVHSPPRGEEADVWKVVAAYDGTTLTTDPPITGLHGVTLDAGDSVQASTARSFEIRADAPIMVGQFIVSQTAWGIDEIKGDPAFVLAVPVEQLRDEYVVLTPERYDEDWITVIKPVGVAVTLDDLPLDEADFTALANSGFAYSWQAVAPGTHRLVGDEPFAVSMFGYDNAVSYGYPGGLDLSHAGDR